MLASGSQTVSAIFLSSGGVAPHLHLEKTSRAGSSTTGAARRRGGSPRYSRNEVPTRISRKVFSLANVYRHGRQQILRVAGSGPDRGCQTLKFR